MFGIMYMLCRCFQQWSVEHSHTRRPGSGRNSRSTHMLHLLCHKGPFGTVCLQQDSDHVCVLPGYHLHHDTAKHGYSGVVKESTGKWNGALLSSLMRVGSVSSLYASDGRTHVRRRPGESHLPECIGLRHIGPTQTSWCGGHQL